MTDTTTLAPTDEEIIAWAMSHQTDAIKTLRASGFVRFARAVLAKWGTPALASSEPDPMLPETKYNLGWASGWDAHARAHPPEKPVALPTGMEPVVWRWETHNGHAYSNSHADGEGGEPLYAAAQVQAMLAHGVVPQLPAGQPSPAERKPLTLEQIGDAARAAHIAFCLDKFPTFEHAIVHFTEQAHGITAAQKGGQHGTT